MSDLNYPTLAAVTLVGRVDKRWDPKGERAPLKLIVQTYKTLQDGRKIPRTDVVTLWGDWLQGRATAAHPGALVTITGTIDSSKDKDGNWRDEIRCESIAVASAGASAPQRAPDPGYGAGDSIPF